MRTIRKIIIFIIFPVTLLGQDIPTITCDTIIKTSEFYHGVYMMEEHIYGGSYWLLKDNFKLYRGYSGHHAASSTKELVGSWIMSNDGLIMTITKSERQRKSETYDDHHRYKVCRFQWKTDVDVAEKHSGNSSILTSVGTVLTDNREFNGADELDKLKQYVGERFKPSVLKPEEEFLRGFAEIDQVEAIVRDYFYKKKILICVKKYQNNNLRIH